MPEMCMLLTTAKIFISKCARHLDKHIGIKVRPAQSSPCSNFFSNLIGEGSLNDELIAAYLHH
jgi:hypothetical protein